MVTDPTMFLPFAACPQSVVVECPAFVGTPFFDEPARAKWVPFFPREVKYENDSSVSRTQLSFVLAWALTPWKAQGMSLDKVVVKLGKAAARPWSSIRSPHACSSPRWTGNWTTVFLACPHSRGKSGTRTSRSGTSSNFALACTLLRNNPTTHARWVHLLWRQQVDS